MIALGIVAFSGITVLGVIPVGLLTLRDAMNDTAESQIVQSVTNDLILTAYNDISSYSPQYYDVEGMPLGKQGGSPPAGTFYTASIVYPKNTKNIPDLNTTIPNLAPRCGGIVTIGISKVYQSGTAPIDTYSVIVASTTYPGSGATNQ
jgi:uncharacterized protein (TIGR02598 family)